MIMTCHHKIGRKSPLMKNERLCAPDSDSRECSKYLLHSLVIVLYVLITILL